MKRRRKKTTKAGLARVIQIVLIENAELKRRLAKWGRPKRRQKTQMNLALITDELNPR